MQRTTYKVYVKVGVIFQEDGRMSPQWMMMNGHRYEINRVTDVARCASLKAGGCGLRYQVQIGTQSAQLYYEDTDTPAWFVESKVPVPVTESEPA